MIRRSIPLVFILAAACSSPAPHPPVKPEPSGPVACTPGWVALDPDSAVAIAVVGDDIVWASGARATITRIRRDGTSHVIAPGGEASMDRVVTGPVVAGDRVAWTADEVVWSVAAHGDDKPRREAELKIGPREMIAVDDGVIVAGNAGMYHVAWGQPPVELFDGTVYEVARDGDDLYFEPARKIMRMPWRGGAATELAPVPWIGPADSMITFAELVVWTDSNRGIQSVAKAGGEIQTALDWRTSWTPTLLAVHDSHPWFSMENTLYTMRDDATAAPVAIADAGISAYAVAGDTIYAGVDRAGIQRLCIDPAAAPPAIAPPVVEPMTCPAGRDYSHTGYEDGCFDRTRSILAPSRSWFHSGELSGETSDDLVYHGRYRTGGKHEEFPQRGAGPVRTWYPDGTLAVDGALDDDSSKHGTWTYYTPTGTVDRVEVWDHRNLVSSRGHE